MMTKQEIEKYLEEVNELLKAKNKHGEILIAGGAALSLIYNARNSTKDIDALFEPSEDFRKIISEIAKKNNLNSDWLNDGVKGFFTNNMEQQVYKEYSNLSVYSFKPECLLAMKLTSARPISKDRDDSLFLMKLLNIKEIAELFEIVEKYANANQLTPKANFFIQEVYQEYLKLQETEDPFSGPK